ncbi:MAG: serine/threonine protein kinase, partial [Candidatus Obscuribacterales bacterium]|nr:serine/threonine protein kinase [Candidatus Obscuribacterales bacterium]
MTSSVGPLKEDLDRKVCLECHRQYTGIVAACTHDGSMLVPVAQDPLVGTKLAGKYDIIRVLGTGGMGVVYEGRHEVMDRRVAIKMLQAHHLNDSMSVKRFQQESKATCRLNHPHIITVFDFGISPTGQPYIVMDYLEGKPLSDIIKEEGQIKVDRAVHMFQQACEALAHAHNQSVIHRDLKPSNIVLVSYEDDKDYVKVVDFGVAKIMEDGGTEGQKLTQMGEVCGSPIYMSPEQCQGFALDKRSDVYSMGIVMYETLTNRLPILGKTMVETMSKHIKDAPPSFSEVRPDLYIPERVEQVILRALAKDPDDRPQSMEHLAREL